jgi:hypothetical protein
MRGRAHNRAQRQRAKARAHHLVANVLRLRGDNPANQWEVSSGEAARLERAYAVDRCAHTPRAVRGEHRQERQAAADEREQTAEQGG